MEIGKFQRELFKRIEGLIKSNFPNVVALIRFYYLHLKYDIMKSLIRLIYSHRRKKSEHRKVLTFCLGGLGDYVLATPFYRNLKMAIPDCKIDAIVFMYIEELLEKNFPLIDRIIPYPINARYMGPFMAWRFFRDLYIENYDYYFCIADYTYSPKIPHNIYGAVIGYVADIPERIGIFRLRDTGLITMEKRLIEKRPLYTRYSFDKMGLHGSETHAVYQHLHLLKLIGVKPSNHDLVLYNDPISDEEINQYLEGFAGENDLVVVLATTSASLLKQWSFRKFAELADRLASDFGAKIVIASSSGEKIGELIKILMNNQCVSFSGDNALSLPQYVSLAKRSHVCIGNDSGPTHIAIAVSTPAVMLFGPSPVNFSRPLDEKRNRIIEARNFSCSTIHNNKETDQLEASSIDLISVNAVYEAFVSILRQEYPQLCCNKEL
jgi:heptosyltransferase-3